MAKEKAGEQTQAVALIRIASRAQQVNDSLLRQKSEISDYAEANNIKIVEWVEIIAPYRENDRPMLLDTVDRHNSVDKVLVHKLSRLTRRFDEYCLIKQDLADRGVKIFSVTEYIDDVGMDSLVEHLLMFNFASQLHSVQSEMVSRSMAQKAKQGYHLSRPPLGYSQGATKGVHEINNDGHKLQKCFQDFNSGKLTVSELREEVSQIYFPLSASEYKTVNKQHFEKIVCNRYYSGFVEFKGNAYKGLHKPLITPEEQEKLKKLLGLDR